MVFSVDATWAASADRADDDITPLAQVRARHNLPSYPSTFVGRDLEITEVAAVLETSRLVTITGAGGIGKTRLALEVARRAGPGQPDGVWLVELAYIDDADRIAESVRAVLPYRRRRARGAPDLDELLRQRRMLLVLDNCEHLVAGCADVVARILRVCPELSVLATSREPLGVKGEHVWSMAPLQLPGADDLDSAALGATEAVRLFVERACAAEPGFSFNVEVAPIVAAICRRLDGLPLAIELVAARLRVLSPSEITERLDDRFNLLTARGGAGERRHHTLRAAIDWSHDLLTEAEATLFRRLGVFAGGWGLRAAETVCAGDDVPQEKILDLLEALVAKSLVVVEPGRPFTRYRMLESIRHFALEKLERSGEGDAIRERHALWCVARAELAERERRGRRYPAWLLALEEDHDNFRAALMWARETQRVDMVLALGGALTWFWEKRGHLREGLEWLTWAVSRAPGADEQQLRAKALRGAGVLSWLLGDVSSAVPLVEESVNLFRRAGNEEEAASCVCSNAFRLCSNPSHSLSTLQANVARIRQSENFDRLAHALVSCGMAHFFLAQPISARTCFDDCLALPLGSLEPQVIGAALLGLGRVAVVVGDFNGAEASLREALDLAVHTSDHDGRSTALSWIAEVARARGNYGRARSLLSDALELVEQRGPALSLARCKQFLARVERDEGNLEAARALFLVSLSVPGANDMPYHRVRSLQGLAEVAVAEGLADEGRVLFEEALAIATDNGDKQAMAQALAGVASVVRAAGDIEQAAKLRHRALDLQEQIGDLAAIVDSLEGLGELAAVGGRPEVAGRLFGAAHAARQSCGCARSPVEEPEYVRDLEMIGARLGGEEFDRVWAQGASLTPAEAVSYAARGRGGKARLPTGWESLTRAERDILRLMTDGRTNAEIGERLFISGRTVSTHLAHVYRKLGISSRRELIRMTKERNP